MQATKNVMGSGLSGSLKHHLRESLLFALRRAIRNVSLTVTITREAAIELEKTTHGHCRSSTFR